MSFGRLAHDIDWSVEMFRVVRTCIAPHEVLNVACPILAEGRRWFSGFRVHGDFRQMAEQWGQNDGTLTEQWTRVRARLRTDKA